MTGASVLLPFLPMLPVQILLNNLLYETSQTALIADHVDEHIMNKPNPWDISGIKRFMVTFGLLSSVFDFVVFFILYKIFHLSGASFQTGWFMQSFFSQAVAIFFIRTALPVWKSRRPHRIVILAIFLSTAIAWTIALSALGHVFGFIALPFAAILAIVGLTLIYFVGLEVTKHFFYKKHRAGLKKTAVVV